MARIPLPRPLQNSALRSADALALGIGRGRTRGPDLSIPFRGVVAPHGLGPLAYLPLLRPGDRFSHTTAASLWPLVLPRVEVGLHVTATEPRNPPRGRGVTGHVNAVDRSVLRHGIPMSDPVALFIELATLLSEDELVAVGDALVLEPYELDPRDLRPWVDIEHLRAGCAKTTVRGCRRARAAAARVRQGAESREESLLRLLILDAGLLEPELQVEIFDARGFIGRFDLVYREARVIIEYDGDQHRTSKTQYERDMSRIDRAIADEWTVVRVRARGLFVTRAETVERVRRALAR